MVIDRVLLPWLIGECERRIIQETETGKTAGYHYLTEYPNEREFTRLRR